MPVSTWTIAEPRELVLDDPVEALHVRVVDGTVNVVGSDEPHARLEISAIEGPPLVVTHEDGRLTVAYEDLPWQDFLRAFASRSRHRSAVVSLVVPTASSVEVGVVGAEAVVSNIGGRTEIRSVGGDATLVGLTGPVRGHSVSGALEAQGVTGDLRFHSVSGGLTVIDGAGPSVRADSVSGDMVLDLAPLDTPANVWLTTVTGEIAVRLPHPVDARVEANTATGSVSNAFEELRVGGQLSAKKITGALGAGKGDLRVTTVSGSIALLRRPPAEDDVYAAEPTGKVL
ncbi:DUF4097 family beta strand repeat-containing protein [Streptomyces sp. NPDC085942]|uniref:DUF4097 family beta strand repeat-containing protein n=1 Tax=Streptomyces sp. NPDC085942 TaxID=3365743 RepID=UPI0037D110EB